MKKRKMPLTITEFASMGGKARKAALTKEQRQEIARKAGSAPKKKKAAKARSRGRTK